MPESAETESAPDRSDPAAHGREAESPQELHRAGWAAVARRTFDQIKRDNLTVLAAGVAFWFFLALVPTIVAVINVYGLVADPSDVAKFIHKLDRALPRDLVRFIDKQLTTITQSSSSRLGLGLAFAVAAAIWSASKGSKALIEATNAAYDEEETRGFLKVRVMSLVSTLGAVLVGVAGIFLMSLAFKLGSHLGPVGPIVAIVIGGPVLLIAFASALGLLYRYAPARKEPRWEWVTPGALVATALWVAGSALFALYANRASSFNETYGSLGAIAVVMLWLLITAFAILLGAEINGEAERQTRRDTTTHPAQPLGQRGAFVADTVAGEREMPEPTERT